MLKNKFQILLARLKALAGSEKAVERAKSVLIGALILSAAALFLNSGLAQDGSSAGSGGQSGSGQQSALSNQTRISLTGPFAIAVTGVDGSHRGIMYDGAELSFVYDSMAPYLGEALGSAGAPQTVEEAAWRSALGSAGFYFDFSYPQPLSLIAMSLGVELTGPASDHTARRILIASEKNKVNLYYQREKDGLFYRCETEISSSSMSARTGDFPSNNASFLFETEYDFPLVDEYFLITEGQARLHSVSAQNPVGTTLDPSALSGVFGINNYTANKYTESDGTSVYVDGNRILRISTDGALTYKNSDQGSGDAIASLKYALDAAQTIVSSTLARCGGIADYGMSYLGYSQEDNSYTIRFSYEIGGYPVEMGGEYAAEFTVTDGVVTSARLNLREYSYSGDEELPLPAVQAMAIVNNKGGGLPLLCYVDNLGSVTVGWAIVE